MSKFRKKPVAIEAIQWNGNSNKQEIESFVGKELKTVLESDTAYEAGKGAPIFSLIIETKEGDTKAMQGDYIIKEPFPTGDRDFYPCKSDVFNKTYELIEDNETKIDDEFLEKRGFVLENQENIIINYVKKINEHNDLVVAVSPLPEFFIWVKDQDFEDPNMEGVKVHIDTDDFEFAEKIAHAIAGVEYL